MNPQYKTCAMRKKDSVKQRGVVLFIALIALVVMSLAAVALIRSVDTNTLIAGNLAFKQSATISADSGLESAITWLDTTNLTNPTTLEANSTANAALGYYPTSACLPLTDPNCPLWPATWGNSNSAKATGVGIDGTGTDASGNTIRYIIQRMCSPGTVAAALDKCLFGAPIAGTGSQGVKSATQAGAITTTGDSPMYRVTARVTGPQNTVSYIQTFVY
jgi:type IV pilus assembly protein PilX